MFYGNVVLKEETVCNINETSESIYLPEVYSYMALSEQYVEDFELLEEGANIEITKKAQEFYKEYKKHIKAAKAALKNKDSNIAKSQISQAKKKLTNFKKEIKNMDSTAGSAIFGFFASSIILMARDTIFIFGDFGLAAGFGYLTLKELGKILTDIFALFSRKPETNPVLLYLFSIGLDASLIAGFIYNIYQLVLSIKKIKESLRNGDKSGDAFNLYRIEMLKTCDKFEQQLTMYKKRIK